MEIIVRAGSIPWLIKRWGGQRLLDAVEGNIATQEAAIDPGPEPATAEDGRIEWWECEPRTRRLYIQSLRPVLAWSITVRHIPVAAMTPIEVRDFLNKWKPGQRKNVRAMLSQLFSIALEEGKLASNPLEKVKITRRKRVKGGRRRNAVKRWPRAVVDGYANVARTVNAWRPHSAGRNAKAQRPWRGGSILVRLMYETAADSTDAIVWTKRENLVTRNGITGVQFDRGKTGESAFVPISKSLAQEIAENGALYLVTDPFGMPYRPVVDDARLRGHLSTLREKAVEAGLPSLIYDHLRHSAATEANECGIAVDDIPHLTAHKDPRMLKEVYLQQSAEITIRIQRARGIIE